MDPKDLITRIAQALVDQPEQVSVNEIHGADTVVFQLTVSEGDRGKVIGKHGRTADALRTILNSVGGKARKRFLLEIVE